MAIKPEELAGEIEISLDKWSDKVAAGMKKAVDTVTKEVKREIKGNIPFNNRTGDYVKAFKTRTMYESNRVKRNAWYVAAPHYRLTHLLEHGHKIFIGTTRGQRQVHVKGGRTRAFPHIVYGERLANRRLPELIEAAVKEGSK